MPAYITLINFTDQGVRDIKETVNRTRAGSQVIQAAGVRWISVWWTLGPYDLVVISESPDEETGVRLLLAGLAQGNIRTMTMRAFNEEEMERILQGLP
jgi:uncharacterized protein with GYD domain